MALTILMVAAAACSGTSVPRPAEQQPAVNTAFYLTMRDGVRIAVDL